MNLDPALDHSHLPDSIVCSRCTTKNSSKNNFCGKCGTPLDIALGQVATYLDENLKGRIDEVLKERFREQSVVETELAARVAERISSWAKLFGVYVGVPLLAAGAYLAWIGFDVNHSLTQLQQKLVEVKKSSDELANLVSATKQRAENLAKTGDELKRKIAESSVLLEQVPALATSVTQLNDRIAGTGANQLLELRKKGQAVGIDASHFDGPLQVVKLKDAGVSFVFLKASEGEGSSDPQFMENCKSAHDAGLACGGYHVLHGGDPESQAKIFIDLLKTAPVDLPPAVTFEPATVGSSPTLRDLKVFASAVERGYGCTPLVYGGTLLRSVADSADNDLARFPLWLAQYSTAPRVIAPWRNWTFWQFTDRLSVNGLPGLDFNTFNGG